MFCGTPGRTTLTEHEIHIGIATPKPYRVPYSYRGAEEMLSTSTIYQSVGHDRCTREKNAQKLQHASTRCYTTASYMIFVRLRIDHIRTYAHTIAYA